MCEQFYVTTNMKNWPFLFRTQVDMWNNPSVVRKNREEIGEIECLQRNNSQKNQTWVWTSKNFTSNTQIKGNQILQNWWNDLLFVHLITVWKCVACMSVCLWFIFIDCKENGFKAIWYYYCVKWLSNFAVFQKAIPMYLGRDPDILCVNYDTCTGYVFMVFFSIF